MNTNTLSTARLEARISTDLHATIKHVADMQNRTMTDFVITAIQEAVQRAVEQTGIIRLSVAGQMRFATARRAVHQNAAAGRLAIRFV